MTTKKQVSAGEIIGQLRKKKNQKNIEGMARFGIDSSKAFGISIPELRKFGKRFGKNHQLAADLWKTDIHEARLLAAFIDDYKLVTERQMEDWVHDFDSWDICDQVCGSLFDKTKLAYGKAMEWSKKEDEFVRRAGFVMMAELAVHDKGAQDKQFESFLKIVEWGAFDDRNFVKKAVNWALRQIGKRNKKLNGVAIKTAERIQKQESKSARWIAADALRELRSTAVQGRLYKI